LQQNVFAHLPGILFLGKPFPHQHGDSSGNMSERESELLWQTVLDIEQAPAGRSLGSELAGARVVLERLKASAAGRIVISDERFGNSKYVPHDLIARRMLAAFGAADILITIRNQFSALPSLYLHEMRTSPQHIEFSKWLDLALADPAAANRPGESIEQFRYNSLRGSFASVFGSEVRTFLYEDFVSDRASYAQRMGEFLGADAATIERLLGSAPQNTAKSRAWHRYRRWYSHIKSVLPFGLTETLPGAAGFVQSLKVAAETIAAWEPPMSVVLSSGDKERIAEYCGADNRALAARLGIDLQANSYPGC
jgi:hypothetical protein